MPIAPSEAIVPAPPPSIATKTRGSHPPEALDVPAQLVDPHRHLESEGSRQGMLAVRPPRQQHALGAVGEPREGLEERRQLPEEHAVRAADDEELAGLRDVLCRRTPVHVAARVAAADPVQLPDQRHQGMAGTRQSGPDRRHVEQGELRVAPDLAGGVTRDDPELGLGLGQGRLHVEPGLIARRLAEERAHPGIGDAVGCRFLDHVFSSADSPLDGALQSSRTVGCPTKD